MTSPLFVVGYLHSGTTLLKWIVARDPRYFTGSGESAFIERMTTFRAMFPDLEDAAARETFCRFALRLGLVGAGETFYGEDDGTSAPEILSRHGVDPSAWDDLLARARSLRVHEEICLCAFDAIARGAGRESWIEKTPTHLFFLDDIFRLVPDARVIEIVRDPRAVLASKRRRRALGRARSAYDPFWDAMAWKSAVQHGDRALARWPDRVLRVLYEDLVRDREKEARRICAFTGGEFRPEMLEVGWVNATATGSPDTSAPKEPRPDSWREELPLLDVAVCQWVAGAAMRRLGHPMVSVPPSVRLRMPGALMGSAVEFFGRLRMRVRHGGPAGLRNLAVNYFRRASGLFAR